MYSQSGSSVVMYLYIHMKHSIGIFEKLNACDSKVCNAFQYMGFFAWYFEFFSWMENVEWNCCWIQFESKSAIHTKKCELKKNVSHRCQSFHSATQIYACSTITKSFLTCKSPKKWKVLYHSVETIVGFCFLKHRVNLAYFFLCVCNRVCMKHAS